MFRKLRDAGIISPDLLIPSILALVLFIVQATTHGSYGYFRDELYYIACTDHLAWGYVDQPPLSIAILWLNRMILGDSLSAMRVLPAVAGSVVVILCARMARRLGGGKLAMGLAALSVAAAPGLIVHGHLFTMNAFDILFWALGEYVVLTVFSSNRPRLWLLFGLVAGLGLLNKYSVGFMIVGLVGGLLLTRQRAHLATRWFWMGAAVATLLFLPHVIWEVTHGIPSLEFMRNASELKNLQQSPLAFLGGQFWFMNVFNAPLWLGGIYFLFTHDDGRYRPLGWMFILVFVIMVAGNAKVYYLSAIYPLFLAAGSVLLEQVVRKRSWNRLMPVYAACLSLSAIVFLPLVLPVLPVEKFISYQRSLGLSPQADERSALAELPQYYADQFGWREMVDSVAQAYAKLTPEERAQCVIYARNYGEAGAIDFFGREYNLPKALCAHNSYWWWGPGDRTGDVAIIIGARRTLPDNLADLGRGYKRVELAATTYAKYAMPHENGRMIFICRGMSTTLQKIWPNERFAI